MAVGRRIADEFLPVLQWARDAKSMPRANKLDAWPHHVRRARAWAQAEAARLAAHRRQWRFEPFPEQVMGLLAVPLRNDYELHTEAVAQRHCVNHLGDRCDAQGLRIFSLRAPGGRLIATLTLLPSPMGYVLDQVRGFANAQVSSATREAAHTLASSYGQVVRGDCHAG